MKYKFKRLLEVFWLDVEQNCSVTKLANIYTDTPLQLPMCGKFTKKTYTCAPYVRMCATCTQMDSHEWQFCKFTLNYAVAAVIALQLAVLRVLQCF